MSTQGVVHSGEHVAAGVEGFGDDRVPWQLLHELGVDAAREQVRGAGVPEVVEADRQHPACSKGLLSGPSVISKGSKAAGAIGESEALVPPVAPEPLGVLDGPVALESLRAARELHPQCPTTADRPRT
jgi:hypothetical protein